MNNPFTKVGRLKNRLRRHYRRATSYRSYLDCGVQMAKIIRPDIVIAERDFNQVADDLLALGEPVPDFRFDAKVPK